MTITVKAFITALGLASLLSLTFGKSCRIAIKNGLPVNSPLLLIPGGSKDVRGFYLPVDAKGIVTLATRQRILFACPGDTNGFDNTDIGLRTALATCDSGTRFYVNKRGKRRYYKFKNFACKGYPFSTARYSGSKCHDGSKSHIEVGFEVESDFYKLMDVCFDDLLKNTSYVKATIVSGIAGSETGLTISTFKEENFFSGMSVDTLYTITTQKQTISKILNLQAANNNFVNQTYFLSRGHLSAKSDFVYASQQIATFRFVNVAPQWQPFNGANWASLESSVQVYADNKKLDLVVYTGTYGVATLPNVKGFETELYLYVDSNNNKAIPVPKFYWKAVYDPKSHAGVVFVGINNPHVSTPLVDYLICTDVCSQISWINWDQKNIRKGYCYCCEVDEFRSRVDYLPQFTVSGLLL